MKMHKANNISIFNWNKLSSKIEIKNNLKKKLFIILNIQFMISKIIIYKNYIFVYKLYMN